MSGNAIWLKWFHLAATILLPVGGSLGGFITGPWVVVDRSHDGKVKLSLLSRLVA